MEMEHINENTIRVLIKSEDLAARGVTFLDLLGNHTEIEKFFYSILEEVDIDEEFKGSEAVTFQVLPKGDGLELFISKNLTIDDLPPVDEFDENNVEDISEFLKQHIEKQIQEPEEASDQQEKLQRVVFEMVDFEQMIQLASNVFLESVVSNLYLMKDFYFLVLEFGDDYLPEVEIANQVALVAEYARRSSLTPEVLMEHGELLMEQDAFSLTRHYFQ
ncbi:MAG: adaptor protein MecA [Enterococcus sp.]